MKNKRYLLTILALAALAAFSSCKADGTGSAPESTVPVLSNVMATADEPDEYAHPAAVQTETEAKAPAVTSAGTNAETSFTGFKDIHAVTPEELAALYADNGWDESTVIHLPVQTAPEGFVPDEDIETTVIDLSDIETADIPENLGEFKDESYWERMPDSNKDKSQVSDKVFIVCVEAGTTDEMMQEVIDKYRLEVVYDYENFNMYALAVPEPLDAEKSADFQKELLDSYSFILSVEPDSTVYLQSDSTVGDDMLK